MLTPRFYEDPQYCLSPFFIFHPPPLPRTRTSLLPLTPTPHSCVCPPHHIWCAILLNDNMDLHMLSLSILVWEGPWCVFYATRCQVYWGLTHVVFYWHSDLILHTQTHKHTEPIQGSGDWHTQINIYLPYLLFAHSSYHCCICFKTRLFMWNKNNTDKNGVNKQDTNTQTHTHTHKHTHTHTHT